MQGLIAGIIMIGVLVVIHEFGHFIVAKVFGVGVPVFSVGFGPRLFGFHWRGTDYRVSLIPAGGYVRMSGADPFGEAFEEDVPPEEDFMRKPVWQRLLVMVAGPLANLILPFVLFTAVLMTGEPQADTSIGTIMPNTPAEQAGLREGDHIRTINGEPLEVWADLVLTLDAYDLSQPVELGVERDGQTLAVTLPAGSLGRTLDGLIDMQSLGIWSNRLSARIGVDDPGSPAALAGLKTGDQLIEVAGQPVDNLRQAQALLATHEPVKVVWHRMQTAGKPPSRHEAVLQPDPSWEPLEGDPIVDAWGFTPVMVYVGKVGKDSPAYMNGVLPGDRVFAVDGVRVRSWSELIGMVGKTLPDGASTPRKLDLVVIREGKKVALEFAPRVQREVVRGEVRYRPIMGIHQYPDAFVRGPRITKYYGLTEAVPRATTEGVMVFKNTVRVLGNLFRGKLKASESVGGPIEIFRMAGEGAKQGIYTFVRLVGTISFSLGIINLLPVPVLDGGQILFYSIEGIRGRPLSLELREKVQMVGVLALFAIMLMVTVMDVSRWLGSS